MKGSRVSGRYAKSLLDLAIEQASLDAAFADMQLVASTCESSRDLVLMLNSPIIKTDQKLAVLKAIFNGKVSDLSMKFITIITTKKRENLLHEIADSFVHQYKELKNTFVAKVTSAVALTADQRASIEKLVSERFGGNIEIVSIVDPSIIGGLILRVNDIQIDASISSKLRELKTMLSGNPYQKAI